MPVIKGKLLECGCQIATDFCPLHAAAPALRDALLKILSLEKAEHAMLNRRTFIGPCVGLSGGCASCNAIVKAAAALCLAGVAEEELK